MKRKRITAFLSAIAVAVSMLVPVTVSHAETTTLTVGTDKQYQTITDALARAKELNPQSEAERVTIEVMPGTYREQLVVDTPYITLKRAEGETGEVNITWYYASSYSYNNCGTDGEYDPNVDWSDPKTWKYDDDSDQLTVYHTGDAVTTISYYDKNGTLHENETVKNGKLGDVANWGAAIRITSGGKYFVTEDIYYSNSFNLYVTQEELDAGVTPSSGNSNPARGNLTVCAEDTSETAVSSFNASKTDYTAAESAYLVRSKPFTERAAAFNCKTEYVTIKNCKMRSNQDTFYCGGTNVYVENSDIYGGTDYIFGEANAVFNNCNLYYEGYSDITDGGVITAASTGTNSEYGYLFMDCTILNARTNTDKGNLGRPWGADAQVTFYNCTIKNNNAGELCVNDGAWGGMSGIEKDEVRFFEYGTKDENGNPVDLSNRVVNKVAPYGTVLNDYQILQYNPRNYLSGWDPMKFGTTYLADVDTEIAASTINVPAGEETVINLPSPTAANIQFHWESASTNAVVSEDGTTITVIRPAAGEDAISTSVILYATDTSTGFGDKKEIPVTIAATTDTTNVFNIPVTIEQSTSAATNNDYTITITKNGALIKEQVVTVPANESTATATIANIPSDTTGIDYDIKVVSQSDEFSIVNPENGVTAVKGVTGQAVTLNIGAQMLVNDKIDLNTTAAASGGNKSLDLIALAKAQGADSSISSSDIITLEYDLDVDAALNSTSYIDLTSVTPAASCNTGANADRMVLLKLNNSWTQLDTVDNTQGFSGSSNSEHQWLNIAGKFDYSTTNHVKMTVNYKTKTITVEGTGSGSYQGATSFTFTSFPENAAKGSLYLGIYPGSTSDQFTVSNVMVTYKKLVVEVDPETVFNIPVTVNTDTALDTDSTYTVKLSKNGEAVTQKTVTVPAGQTTAAATIEDIQGSTTGIKYDVEIVCSSSDMMITSPADGKTTITGISKQDVPITVTAGKVNKETKSFTVTSDGTGATAANSNGTYTVSGNTAYYFDLNAIANDSNFADSTYVTVKYDITQATQTEAAVDITANTPDSAYSSSNLTRIIRAAFGRWDQINIFTGNNDGYGNNPYKPDGSSYSNTTGQFLNIDDKSVGKATATIETKIDLENNNIILSGWKNSTATSGTPATMNGNLPDDFSTLYLAVYPNGSTITISNITVTYETKTLVNEPVSTTAPTGTPAPAETAAPINTPAPTETTAPAETTAPTETTAPIDTPAPELNPAIKNVTIENGNTVVTLENIGSGTVIAVEYDGDTLKSVNTAEVPPTDQTEKTVTINGIEADVVYVWNSLKGMEPLCDSYTVANTPIPTPTVSPSAAPVSTKEPITDAVTVDFTTMSVVPEYTAENGQGFVTKSDAIMPSGYEREVAPLSAITVSSEGATVTESTGSYLNYTNSNGYNYGGLIYRIDTGAPGAYHLEVEITGTSSDTRVAPTGMDSSKLTSLSNWDNAGNVPRTVSASWSGSTWSYDFATGEDFVEIEIEPSALATESASKTVGIKKITVTPLENNAAGEKPTIHILGDSTQKTYTFNEIISSWGQTLANYFDPDKVNVINYSMGGRAMKSNYNEGRFDEILISGKTGDYVFIHSAHNDETVSNDRFERGASTGSDLTANNENYNRWLDMYVEAIKARGMIPVLVTSMPRINGGTGAYSENTTKPNGFNPDAPGNMRAKAASDEDVALVELYDGAKAYIDKLDPKEVIYIYNSTEAGETPANNSANGANSDGTHYKEAAAKQWNRIMLQSIYDQSVAADDTYTDKDIMKTLVSLMSQDVQDAAQSGDWSAVFPEMASDVSAVDVVPGATKQSVDNYYYRNNIEKALQLGLLHKDSNNLFKPTQTITVGEFARGIEKAFGLEENSLTSYTKTYDELTAQASASDTSAASLSVFDIDTIFPFADGDTYTVTVEQPTGGTVTIYNESAFHTATVDVPASVTASAVIGDNDYFTLTAPAEIASGSDSSGVFAENNGITKNYIEFRNSNPEKKVIYTAKASGIITVYARFNNNKYVELLNQSDNSSQSKYIGDEETLGDGSTVYGIVHFNVEAGNTYELYARGGTGRLFGVKYESTDYPQSTTSLTVNAGDTIRVAATPSDNYLNKAILVNNEEKATGKEYTFTVTTDTTVSASFTSEPALLETTKIASDAALTREVMGAILYDAYLEKYGKETDGKWNKVTYMNQNGGVPSPDDPNYDPNIKYEGSPYIPLTGWGALEDISDINTDLYQKVKEAYNLGLIRSEQGIARGSIACGNVLEPKVEVTRAKAAKALVFAFILTQPTNGESQIVPDGYQPAAAADIAAPNPDASTEVFD